MAVTIVCADDDRNFCQILARALRAEGYRVETAHDGDSALEQVRVHEPALVTLDVMLPKRDGFAVLEALRAETGLLADVPVVLFSGCRFTPGYTERAEALRADAVLHKPVPLERILQTVREHVRSAPRPRATARPAGAARRSRAASAPAAGRRRKTTRPAAARKRHAATAEEGSLEEMPFPMLLHHLHGMRANGV
ncbi:MAG: response regulator, partial [Myxococcota bacterium]|nr:response regulator [Myxococcota bacterium]